MKNIPTTALCRHENEAIWYREQNLVEDLLGKRSFTDVLFEQILGHRPNQNEVVLADAVLVMLMDHGLTPSAIAARLTYMSSPENIQAGVAAGLLGVGSQFIGTMEDCGRILADLRGAPDLQIAAQKTASLYRTERRSLPGFGHHLHKPDDPRAKSLIELARVMQIAGANVTALLALSDAVDAAVGRHITINATGAAAAVLGDLGVPIAAMRGFAVISRAAGLVAHLVEESKKPSGRFIWELVDREIPYVAETPLKKEIKS
ncbi:citryl-CoA lyase [Variovorax sp. EL159]|uniref:citryl-CoA lyase n=1 Tax=Variovorax sp. EL159 TaxID=1566270 RepID=UPI000890F030|nr:citryl-CoA lyase [Variovorax sp. EL159]SCX72524.1 citrate synthase [Variovorax sp. EL159]